MVIPTIWFGNSQTMRERMCGWVPLVHQIWLKIYTKWTDEWIHSTQLALRHIVFICKHMFAAFIRTPMPCIVCSYRIVSYHHVCAMELKIYHMTDTRHEVFYSLFSPCVSLCLCVCVRVSVDTKVEKSLLEEKNNTEWLFRVPKDNNQNRLTHKHTRPDKTKEWM